MKEKQFAFWSLLGMILLAYFPYWTDYMFLAEDTMYYLSRTEEAAGTLGGPLLLVVPALLRRVGCSVMLSHKILLFLLVAGSALSAYWGLGRILERRKEALLGTLFYQLSPWCIAVLYRRCAVGTYLVIVFLPLMCGGILGVIRQFVQKNKSDGQKAGAIQRVIGCVVCLMVGVFGLIESYGMNAGNRYSDGVQFVRDLLGALFLFGACVLLVWLYEKWGERYIKSEDRRQGVNFVLILIALTPAIYLLNRIVLTSGVYYLYTSEQLCELREAMQAVGETAVVEKTANAVSLLRVAAMLLTQVGTLGTSYLWFSELFSKEKNSRYYGMLLYMTLPCRIRVCCDLMDLARAVIWMLIPLALWAVTVLARRRVRGEKRVWIKIVAGAVFVSSLAGMGVLARHIGARSELLLGSIMQKGYSIGGLFSFFVYREDRPGLGAALLISLLVGLWLLFVKGSNDFGKECRIYLWCGLILTLMSLRYFPWDYVQRLGDWALRAVSALETPAIFFGAAQIALCVPGAKALELLDAQENEELTWGVRLMVFGAGICYCVFRVYIR